MLGQAMAAPGATLVARAAPTRRCRDALYEQGLPVPPSPHLFGGLANYLRAFGKLRGH